MEKKGEGNGSGNGKDGMGSDQEKKIEEFFALIRSYREAWNRRKSELNGESKSEESEAATVRKRKTRSASEERPRWVPSLEWEDFTTKVEFRSQSHPPVLARSAPDSKKKKEEEKEEDAEGEGLDLKLTL
ncbi:protein NIM1-INTERACTING 1-like [Malania oleifera]|uniref:protein NIM1-INTERACTING 1-like n=1 Tax=Malania oleifera TaxID=397392 RepID=UPI0025AE961C|nr:protein NIM1-INTERACTING 1-like [Malania oleifera]